MAKQSFRLLRPERGPIAILQMIPNWLREKLEERSERTGTGSAKRLRDSKPLSPPTRATPKSGWSKSISENCAELNLLPLSHWSKRPTWRKPLPELGMLATTSRP